MTDDDKETTCRECPYSSYLEGEALTLMWCRKKQKYILDADSIWDQQCKRIEVSEI